MKKHIPIAKFLIHAVLALVAAAVTSPCNAAGHIDASTLVSTSHGIYRGVHYTRYEAMFAGQTSNKRPYRVPCQIITPTHPGSGSGLLLQDWPPISTVYTAVGQEQADARYTMTDDFLFGLGISYAIVRSDPDAIGTSSPVPDYSRPWSDDLLDTSSEFILSADDEFDIFADYARALRTDPVATAVLGPINRRAAFGYSAGGTRLRGLLRMKEGVGLFDFSLVGGAGAGYTRPKGNALEYAKLERPSLPGAGLEIDFQSETDVLNGGYIARHEEPNYRVYQFAGAAHIRDIDVEEFGLPDPETANSAEWTPFIRALFVAANNWCSGILPPPTLWLGAPNDPNTVRDAKGNALVTYVGGQPVNDTGYRLPEVAVGENQYIPYAPSYDDGTFLGMFRSIGGARVDLTGTFTDHDDYVNQITAHARRLQADRYLLEADADAIIEEAEQSDIGKQ